MEKDCCKIICAPPPPPPLRPCRVIGWTRLTMSLYEGWLVGCFGFNGPLRQYFSLYRAVSQREGERRERIDESKNVQTTPTRTYCKRNRPLPYCNQNCRTPRHWKFTQHHRTTRPPPYYTRVSNMPILGQFARFLFMSFRENKAL